MLTGKYKRGQERPEGARLSGEPWGGRNYFREEAFTVVETLEELAAGKGCATSQLALAWCLRQPAITSPIIGPRTMEQLEDNLGALEVEVTAEDRKRLDEVAPPGRAIVPFYEADFGPHPHRW
jgi:aryl-alcohol dehydrogenase-like predicted oxidoreductase